MTKEQINELIIKMEDAGYSFAYDGPSCIGFWTPENADGERSAVTWYDWCEVEDFIKNNLSYED